MKPMKKLQTSSIINLIGYCPDRIQKFIGASFGNIPFVNFSSDNLSRRNRTHLIRVRADPFAMRLIEESLRAGLGESFRRKCIARSLFGFARRAASSRVQLPGVPFTAKQWQFQEACGSATRTDPARRAARRHPLPRARCARVIKHSGMF